MIEEMYSFISLFSMPVDLDRDTRVTVDRIVIPRIQRPYAQGRMDGVSTYVRKTLLDEVFSDLSTGAIVDFNFIYGIIRPTERAHVLELLDGQQRLTTLFLLYWYAANRELSADDGADSAIRDCLHRFIYETRNTSSVFCQKLAGFRTDLSSKTPREAISNAKWYFKSFDRDSTICAMLTMLDAIHEKYNSCGMTDLHARLDNVRFYVKSLGYYNLSEELYIKMNARGLQLSPFESFKADLTGYISSDGQTAFSEPVQLFGGKDGEMVPFRQDFSIRLDAKWVDLFWKKGAEDFDASYLSFFTRFFACKYIVVTKDEVTDRDMRSDEVIKALYTDAEERLKKNEFFGFAPFKAVIDRDPKVVNTLARVLDLLYQWDYKDPEHTVSREFVSVWDRRAEDDRDDSLYTSQTRFTQVKLIVFAALIEFVEAFDVFDPSFYREWMRIVWNIVENTNIDSLTPVSSLVRRFAGLAGHIASCAPSDIPSFYRALSGCETGDQELRAVTDEIRKAGRIAEDSAWLPLFREAERHPFLRGLVLFFYDDGMSPEAYKAAFGIISGMFDDSGISPEFRKQHVLIRAIASRYLTWGEIRDQFFTERAERNKYLKNKLAAKDAISDRIRAMMNRVAKEPDMEGARAALERSIDESEPFRPWDGITDDYLSALELAVRRLRHDVGVWDWISGIDSGKDMCFRVYWFDDHVMFAVPRAWYAKIALDTDRASIAYNLYTQEGFMYEDNNQRLGYEAYRESSGKEIWLRKPVGDAVLRVGFRLFHKVSLEILFPTVEDAQRYMSLLEGATVAEGQETKLSLPEISHFPNRDVYGQLTPIIHTVCSYLSKGDENN